jgi:GAF domain-containing protein
VIDPEAPRQWLLSHVDQLCIDDANLLLEKIADLLAMATNAAVSVRALTPDGQCLIPLIAFHPDPTIREALAAVMAETQSANHGLWLPVIQERQPRSWRTTPGGHPPEASARQAGFLERFPIRAVLAMPLQVEDRVVGGVSLMRFADQGFTDHDQALLVAAAERLAPAVYLRTTQTRVREPLGHEAPY